MASNIFSKFLPPNTGSPSIYETLRQHDDASESDIEERAGMTLDEENLGEAYHDFELNDALGDTSTIQRSSSKPSSPSDWPTSPPKAVEAEDLDDDVPQSLLIEGGEGTARSSNDRRPGAVPLPVYGPASRATRAKWQATQQQQRLHHEPDFPPAQQTGSVSRNRALGYLDPKERALWRWANLENLDNFLFDVYNYYVGNGIWSILLNRVLTLL